MVPMNEQTTDHYNVLSRYYDLEFDSFDADIDMYRQFVETIGGPVLELGCGSGRILQRLQDLDVQLAGVDDSTSMLGIASERLGPGVKLEHQDMRYLEHNGTPYAFVFCAVNTFLHLQDVESQLLALDSINSVTAHDGVLLLDLFTPDPEYLAGIDGRIEQELDTEMPDGSRLIKWTTRSLDAIQQTIFTTAFYDTVQLDGSVIRAIGSYTTRYIHLFELEHLLARTGWDIVSIYGGYDLHPLDSTSERMIVLATPDRED
jgi:SAM-dependent methyltransferase